MPRLPPLPEMFDMIIHHLHPETIDVYRLLPGIIIHLRQVIVLAMTTTLRETGIAILLHQPITGDDTHLSLVLATVALQPLLHPLVTLMIVIADNLTIPGIHLQVMALLLQAAREPLRDTETIILLVIIMNIVIAQPALLVTRQTIREEAQLPRL